MAPDSGNRRLQQEAAPARQPERPSSAPTTRSCATVFSPVDNWRCRAFRRHTMRVLSRATSPHMRADLWQRGCERLASELPDQQFNTWIRPLPDADVADNGEAARRHRPRPEPLQARLDPQPVRRPDRDRAQRARRQAGPPRRHARAARRQRALGRWRRGSSTSSRSLRRRRAARASRRARTATPARRQRQRRGAVANGVAHAAAAALPSRSRLNPALTFDTLVEGRPTAWRAPPRCTSPARPASCTTRFSSTAASAWARPT